MSMPLTLTKKKQHLEEIKAKIEENDILLFVDPIGLNVARVTDLRNKLREKGVGLKIYKNTLIGKAIEESGQESLTKLKDHLEGPTAIVFTSEDPIIATKVIIDFAKENKELTLKAASCEGDFWDVKKMEEYSSLGSKSAIYGKLVGALYGPISKLIFVLGAPGSELVGTLKSIAEKDEKK